MPSPAPTVRTCPSSAYAQPPLHADCLVNKDIFEKTLVQMQITGGINSNDKGTNHILHHTIGRSDSTEQEIEAYPAVCVPCGAHRSAATCQLYVLQHRLQRDMPGTVMRGPHAKVCQQMPDAGCRVRRCKYLLSRMRMSRLTMRWQQQSASRSRAFCTAGGFMVLLLLKGVKTYLGPNVQVLHQHLLQPGGPDAPQLRYHSGALLHHSEAHQ